MESETEVDATWEHAQLETVTEAVDVDGLQKKLGKGTRVCVVAAADSPFALLTAVARKLDDELPAGVQVVSRGSLVPRAFEQCSKLKTFTLLCTDEDGDATDKANAFSTGASSSTLDDVIGQISDVLVAVGADPGVSRSTDVAANRGTCVVPVWRSDAPVSQMFATEAQWQLLSNRDACIDYVADAVLQIVDAACLSKAARNAPKHDDMVTVSQALLQSRNRSVATAFIAFVAILAVLPVTGLFLCEWFLRKLVTDPAMRMAYSGFAAVVLVNLIMIAFVVWSYVIETPGSARSDKKEAITGGPAAVPDESKKDR